MQLCCSYLVHCPQLDGSHHQSDSRPELFYNIAVVAAAVVVVVVVVVVVAVAVVVAAV